MNIKSGAGKKFKRTFKISNKYITGIRRRQVSLPSSFQPRSQSRENEGNRFEYLFSLKLSLTRHDQRSCEQKCKHTFKPQQRRIRKFLLQLQERNWNDCVRAWVVCLCLGLSCCGGLAEDRRTRTRK
jgi:hypothetical protein